jgi:hypothetical protein
MAWAIYSVEGFPGVPGSGREREFIRALGVQIVLKPKTWMPLNDRYTHSEPGLPTDLAGTPGKKVYTAEEIARRVVEKYGDLGLVATRKDEEHLTLEKKAADINVKWRKSIIQGFEEARQKALATGGRGLREPTTYELDCYRVLGVSLPTEVNFASRREEVAETRV